MKHFFILPAHWYLIAILILSGGFLIYTARTDSAIMDELAHIPAGYSYVKYMDYRLNPEHPPLLKILSGLPLLAKNLQFPDERTSWTDDINGQWNVGTQFLYEEGNNADDILLWSRMGPILLTILTIILLYGISKELLGSYWGLIPTMMFALSPTVLAHGHYVTTDIAATGAILLSLWLYAKFLKKQNAKHIIIAGIGLGIAQIAKFSAVLLAPTFIAMIGIYWLSNALSNTYGYTIKEKIKQLGRLVIKTALIATVAFILVIIPTYSILVIGYPPHKQTEDTTAILSSFGGEPTPQNQSCTAMRCLADGTIALTKHSLTRPLAQYFLGVLMVTQRASGGNTNYFLYQVSAEGSRWYFPIVYITKESIPVLILLITSILIVIKNTKQAVEKTPLRQWFKKTSLYPSEHPAETILCLFMIVYWMYSIKSPLNIGVRHILPTIPILYMFIIKIWKQWIMQIEFKKGATILDTLKAAGISIAQTYTKIVFVTIMLVWILMETILTAPYFLSYFNQFAGGVSNGYKITTDSNYDWGQDLTRLKKFINEHPEIKTFAIDYFGGGNPAYYFGAKAIPWSSDKGNPRAKNIEYLVISINTLQSAMQPAKKGFNRAEKDMYTWLTAEKNKTTLKAGMVPIPDYRVGTSLFIYKL